MPEPAETLSPTPAWGLALAEPLRGFAGQVLANCRRADAEVSGHFSLCGLLLRLRNLYKWEHGLPPWQEPDPAAALEWVSQREELWLEVLGEDPQPVSLDGMSFDPFDAEAVNQRLLPQGLVYGAGRAGGLIPVFFLGRLAGREVVEGMEVFRVGAELGRDILFLPGLRQDGRIYLRREPLAFLLWDKIADPRKSLIPFLDLGLGGYGLERRALIANPTAAVMEALVQGEERTVLWHELGEAAAGARAGELLRWAVAALPGGELEHFTRGVKDLLADTCDGGRLARIIAERAMGPLGFYPAWLGGFPRLLFPEVDAAILTFADHRDWAVVEEVRQLGLMRARQALAGLEALAQGGLEGEDLRLAAHADVIAPLTGGRPLPPRPE
ncbi:MAG: hypothetical protein V1797_04940 [Pseudomonadota bacterium]